MSVRGDGTAELHVGAEHPALAGHFPGSPVVPGVVLLERVLELAGARTGVPLAIDWIKFRSPLLPGDTAQVQWAWSGASLRFSVQLEGRALASGALRELSP